MTLPDLHDLEVVALAGLTLGPVSPRSRLRASCRGYRPTAARDSVTPTRPAPLTSGGSDAARRPMSYRAAALRDAFAKTMRDPAFLEDAEKRRLLIDPMPGEEISQLFSTLQQQPKEVAERAEAIFNEQ